MIDIENQVFSKVSEDVRATYPDANMTSEETLSPPSFPCVSVVEIDNYVVKETLDSSLIENHARVTYEVNVFVNNASNKKAECKKIFNIVDKRLMNMGFVRTTKLFTSTNNSTVCRLTGRYTAVVSKDEIIYGGY